MTIGRDVLTGSALTWLTNERLLPGIGLAERMLLAATDDRRDTILAALDDVVAPLHGARRTLKPEDFGGALRKALRKPGFDLAQVYQVARNAPRAAVREHASFLTELLFLALADAGCSVAATLDSVAVPERSLALKVPEPLQKQLFTVREEMARAVWGAPVETVGLADWRHARQVFFEAARLRTRRRPEDYRKYTVQMVARLSGGKDPRVTETRFVVCPETAAEDVAKALARRFIPSGATV